jgi:hypothetical protein
LRVVQDDRVSRCLVRCVTDRDDVAGAVTGEAKTVGGGDLATDVDGLGGIVLAGTATVPVDSDWLG